MIVLGVDPGTIKTGWAVVDSDQRKPLAYGLIRLSQHKSMEHRLGRLHAELATVLAEHDAVEWMGVETQFVGRHLKSGLVTAMARGVVMACAALNGAKVHSITPAEIKKAVAGHGHAPKPMMLKAVKALTGLRGKIQEDSVDAIGVAIVTARRMTENSAS